MAARQRWSPEGQSSQETNGHMETSPSRGALVTRGHCSWVNILILFLSRHCFQKAHGSLRSKSTFGSLVRLLGAVSDCWRAGKCFGYFLLCFGGWGEGGKAKTRGRSLKIRSGVHMSVWVS